MSEPVTVMVKGYPVLLDADFADDFDSAKWYIHFKHGKPTAVLCFARVIGQRPHRRNITARLHAIVVGAKAGEIVDHINRNPLDNRRCNLRVVPNGVNRQNAKLNRNNKSGFRGVFFIVAQKSRPWRAQGAAGVGGKHQHLGYFATAREAALAYNTWTSAKFGEHAALNNT